MGDSEMEIKEDAPKTEESGTGPVPSFIQIVAAVSNALGRTENDVLMSDYLYGLDRNGRVWEWRPADPDRVGSVRGWELLPNVIFKEGEEPPAQRRSR